MIRCAIIEDQPSAAEVIRYIHQKNFPEFKIEGVARDVSEGVALLRKTEPDLVLTDVELPSGTGFDILNVTSDIPY